MTVSTYTYGTVAGVQQRVGWVVPDRTFGSSTTPTYAEVEHILDQIAADIHTKLAEAGYPIDTKTTITANAPRAATWLELLNELGACAEIVMSFAQAGDTERDENPSGYYRSSYKNSLKMIGSNFLHHLGLSKERNLSDNLVCTSDLNEDGEEKKPLFKRSTFDYPGARTIVEDED